MPLYEYKCAQCGIVFEVLQRLSDQPVTVHNGCGGAVERLFSASSFQFKGSGFYATDYGKKGQGANGSKKKQDSGSEPAAAPPPKTESTTACKPDSAR